MANIYNSYKWNITFKNCESLYCTPVTYNIVQQLYFDKQFQKKHKNFKIIIYNFLNF